MKWRQSLKNKTYILHITATCSGYFNIAIVRLYAELWKGNYLHKTRVWNFLFCNSVYRLMMATLR